MSLSVRRVGDALHAVGLGGMPFADSPARQLRRDVGRPQSHQPGNAGIHAGQPRAMAGDAGGDALLRRRPLWPAPAHAPRGPGRSSARPARQRAAAASRSARRSRAGRCPAGRPPGSSSAGTCASRRGRRRAGCRGSRPACRRCAGSTVARALPALAVAGDAALHARLHRVELLERRDGGFLGAEEGGRDPGRHRHHQRMGPAVQARCGLVSACDVVGAS